MKTFGYISLAALLAFASCTNEINDEGVVDKANTIAFSAYSNKTRAYPGGDADISVMKTGSFGVVGYINTDNTLFLGSASKAIEQVWKTDASYTGGGYWDYNVSSELKYWPSSTMDFYAYFPYSGSGDTFASSSKENTIMTITNETGNQDVLFARQAGQSQTAYVPLRFNHAFSKIKAINIKVAAVDVSVTVQKVEVLNTSTKGKVLVDNTGNASYATTESDKIRSFDLSSSPKTINYGTDGVELFGNEANGYLFATNSSVQHYVKGTGKTMWSGNKADLNGGNLSTSEFVCLKLTCKVKAAGHYLVGSESNYGEMYIPMHGTSANSADISELLAGRRYTYNIIMQSNVGYEDDGDPIMLAPIRFSVNEVTIWNDVTVTINL